jgi:hypothetical protein
MSGDAELETIQLTHNSPLHNVKIERCEVEVHYPWRRTASGVGGGR